MSARAELQAAFEKAEAAWRRAKDDVDSAQACRARAYAGWERVVNDRRFADAGRRKAGATWDNAFPDRRDPGAGRRKADADLAAFSKEVADRHKAYVERGKAETGWVEAEVKLAMATAERERAIAAIDGSDRK